jgi:hypothetical protein
MFFYGHIVRLLPRIGENVHTYFPKFFLWTKSPIFERPYARLFHGRHCTPLEETRSTWTIQKKNGTETLIRFSHRFNLARVL